MARTRASYRAAIAWVAVNDSAGDPDAGDVAVVSGLASCALVADLFGKDETDVARDVVRYRLNNEGH